MNPLIEQQLFTELWQATWHALAEGVENRHHAFHYCTMSMCDDATPYACIMTVRAVDCDARSIRMHADIRSMKVQRLRRSPQAMLVLYDPASKRYVRARCSVRIHDHSTDLARVHWQKTPLLARRCYGAPLPPSTPSDTYKANLPECCTQSAPVEEDTVAWYTHFCVIECIVTELDVCELHFTGHVRATFTCTPEGYAAQWCTP